MSKPPRKTSATRPGKGSKPRRSAKPPRQASRIEVAVNGVPVEVSLELEAAVHRACQGLRDPLPREMTTTQAADFLDVSRPFVIKLTRRGELPCRLVGTHRRIPSAALLEYREKMFQQAKRAADEMAHLSQDLGLYETGRPSHRAP